MPALHLSNGIITDLTSDRGTTLATINYMDGPRNRQTEQTVRLAIGPRTVILNPNGIPMPVTALSVGATINAVFSSAMTRSIPPQAAAYMITIIRRPRSENITTGHILEIDRSSRSFTTISGRDPSTIIRFNVADNAVILDRFGRPMNFNRLSSGMRVRVRHASFMTASIPPQTTAFEVRVV